MADRQEIIKTLCKIEGFFSGCRDNAHEGSQFKALFQGYMDAAKGAAELLKEQEPRVLTLEELDAIFNEQQNHVWPYNSPPYLWMTVNPEIRRTNGFWICWRDIVSCLTDESPFYTRENYNKSWKIWFKEPTDEQRNAVPWARSAPALANMKEVSL